MVRLQTHVRRNLGGWVHSAYGWPNYLFWTAVVGLFIAIGALNPRDHLRSVGARALGLCWGHWMWWTTPFWWRRWRGLENVGEGPYIIVANHQSTIDIPCLFGLPLPMKLSARGGIFRVPVMGHFLRWSGQVDTDAFFEQAKAALEGGYSVAVFPEGSRSVDGEVQRFRSGAFKLAVDTGTPILPVAMDGAQSILCKRHYIAMHWWAVVDVLVMEPIEAGDDPKALSATTRGQIIDALQDIRSPRQLEAR